MSCAVVLPTYRGAGFLHERLAGIFAQTHLPTEVIVIDDGSPDDTPAIMSGYVNRVLYRRTENQGVQAARNFGVDLATSDWIVFADQDDLWEPDHIRRTLALAEADPALAMIFSDFRVLRDGAYLPRTKFEEAPQGWWDSVIAQRLPEGWLLNDSICAATLRFHPIFPSALAMRRDFFHALGGFDTVLRGNRAEDGPFVTRALVLGRAGAVPYPTVTIRKHADNFSADSSMPDKMLNLLHEISNLRYLRDRFPEMVPLRDAIDQEIVVRSKLAAEAAFAIGDHARMREILRAVPLQARDRKLALKVAVAALPDPVALPLNRLLQGLAKLRA